MSTTEALREAEARLAQTRANLLLWANQREFWSDLDAHAEAAIEVGRLRALGEQEKPRCQSCGHFVYEHIAPVYDSQRWACVACGDAGMSKAELQHAPEPIQ